MAENVNQNNPQQQREFNDAINDYRSLLRNISDELGKQRTHVADANAEYRKLDSIARQIQNTEEGISGLTSEQLNKLKGKYEISLKEIKNQAEQLLRQRGIVNLTQTQLNYLKEKGKLDSKSTALLQGYLDDLELEKGFTERIEESTKRRVKYEEDIKSLTGATGALLDGMNSSMKALGLGAAAQYLQIDKAKQAMQEEADAIARGEKVGGKLQVRMAGIKVLAEGLNKALFSTEAIIGFITSALLQGSQNMADFQKQTGMSYGSAYKLNTEMNAVAAATGDAFITGQKLGKAYASLTNELGVSADILGNQALVSATNLEQRLGMSAEQSSKLTVFARLQGKDTEKVLSNATATVGAFNNQNKTAINVRAVMDDVANASKATYLNMGKNVTALTQAATKAKSLGLSLKDLETVSESLLDFESSIGKELEAQLLTGGNINLAKAREYALTGDMKGLGEEIGKQEGILTAFRTNNVIAQKAAADALGITREQLAEMTMQQELNTLGAEKFKKQYGESAYESMKARSAAEGFGDAIEKIKSILGSIFQAFSPLLDGIVTLLNLPFVPQLLAGAVAIKVISGGLFSSIKSMGSLAKGALDFVKNLNMKGISEFFGGLKSKFGELKGAFGEGLAGKVQEKVADAGGGLADKAKDKLSEKAEGAADGLVDKLAGTQDKTKTLNKGAGEGIKGFFQALGTGFQIFARAMATPTPLGPVGVVMAVSLAVITGAIIGLGYALGLAAPGIQAFGTVVTAAFAGIATLITAVADGFVKILGAVTMENIGPMLLLGPALFGIAAGLSAVSLAGLMALPAIGGLVLLSKAAPALVSLGIGGENKSAGEAKGKGEGGVDALIQKVATKVTELTKGRPVQIMLDGKVAATAIVGGGGGAAKTQSSQR